MILNGWTPRSASRMARVEFWDVENQILAIRPYYPRARLFHGRRPTNLWALLVIHPQLGVAWIEVRSEAIAPLLFRDWRLA